MITTDLGKERPQWILSAYGPGGKEAPIQLFGGPIREQSFEELRARHYELAASGNQQQAIQEAQRLVSEAEQQINNILKDVDGAMVYIANGENQHPNRVDICKAKGADSTPPQISGGARQTTSAFGQPTFGSPTLMSTQTQAATSSFTRPSTSFGQPSALGSTFGQPSSLGQPQSLFGKQTSSFGQPSALGRPPVTIGLPTSSFGRTPSSGSAFGQTTAASPFGSGQGASSTQDATAASGVTQPRNVFEQRPASSQPTSFEQPSFSANRNPFGPAATANANTFSQTSSQPIFAKPNSSQSTTTFGQPTVAQLNQTPESSGQFGHSGNTNSAGALNPPSFSAPATTFGQPSAVVPAPAFGGREPNSTTTMARKNPATNPQRNAAGKLISWKGKPVSYSDEEPCIQGIDGSLERIWFADGPPVFLKTEEPPLGAYDEGTKEVYRLLRETGTLKDGVLPELPPRREWCSWDF
ncbi:hypothetical protein MMC07_005137 [Pseudocyphellaria aurata]|nr:hypothetical protein [Pseudocyphellaria aurata]